MTNPLYTTETLQAKAYGPGMTGRLAHEAAQAWMRRASSLARAGLHSEADDATTEAIALGRMAEDLL